MRKDSRVGLLVLTTAVITLVSAGSARATLLAYEGFDYSLGVLTGNSGGSGFNGAWLQNGGDIDNSYIVSGSFGYTVGGYSLVTAGNRGHVTGDATAAGDNNPGGNAASAQPLRGFNFARGTNGAIESTWISMIALRTGLANPTPGAPPNDYLYGRAMGAQFFFQATTSTAAGNEQFSIGRATQSSETGANTAWPNDTWTVSQQGNANGQKPSTIPFASAPADFLLIRIDHVGSTVNDTANADTMRMWINPGDLNVAPLDASADIIFNANEFAGAPTSLVRDWIFNKLRLFGGGTQTTPSGSSYGSMELDEVRIGETFADVTPNTLVPEPSVALVGGLGALLFVLHRRRRAV